MILGSFLVDRVFANLFNGKSQTLLGSINWAFQISGFVFKDLGYFKLTKKPSLY